MQTRYEAFPGSMGSVTLLGLRPSSSRLSLNGEVDLPASPAYTLKPGYQYQDDLPFCVPPSLKRLHFSTGILTCFPSPTPLGLGLGTD